MQTYILTPLAFLVSEMPVTLSTQLFSTLSVKLRKIVPVSMVANARKTNSFIKIMQIINSNCCETAKSCAKRVIAKACLPPQFYGPRPKQWSENSVKTTLF